jgi:hypothetical protein
MFLEHLSVSSRTELVELAIGDLVLGRDPGVSDQGHGASVQQPSGCRQIPPDTTNRPFEDEGKAA